MVRRSLRSSLWSLVVALGFAAQPLHAQTSANVVPVRTFTGFYNNTAVYFTAFDSNSLNFASANGLTYAPRLSNANAAGLDNMIFFMNGATGQAPLLQSEPGLSDYSPLWHVVAAAWQGKTAPPVLTSYAQAVQLWQAGQLALQSTNIIFNGPVIVINRPLNMAGGGNLAPTISPNEFAGINVAANTAFFVAHQGYAGGQIVTFLALEHAVGQISMAPGAIPVNTIDLTHLGHAAVANFFVPPGQLPLLDSFPASQTVTSPATGTTGVTGTTGATTGTTTGSTTASTGGFTTGGTTGSTTGSTTSTTTGTTVYGGGASIAGKGTTTPPTLGATGQTGQTGQTNAAQGTGQTQVPSPQGATGQTGQTPPVFGATGGVEGASNQIPTYSLPPFAGYSPIWHVHMVQFPTGVSPGVLTSLQALANALAAGQAVQIEGGTEDTFDCPIVSSSKVTTVPAPQGATGQVGQTGQTQGATGQTGQTGQTPTTSTGGVTGTTGTTGATGTTGYTPGPVY